MGRVWAARRLRSPTLQWVAVKTSLESTEQNPDSERLFIDEASIASRIEHPNVCAILGQGTERGVAYLVMEWVHGGTLHEILAASPSRRIDCCVAAYIITKVCAGLHAAHELRDGSGLPMNVVHRDVSPQNILISEAGTVKLSDFGVARAKNQLHRTTKSGEFKGKLSYMAPEQLTRRQFDRRADIFALGCVLYQATTGRRPFQGDDALETMYRLLETDCDRPSLLTEGYPKELESIVLTALAKDAGSRFQTAEAFEQALQRFLATNHHVVSETDVAALVEERLRDQLMQRSHSLEIAVAEFDQREPIRQDPGADKHSSLLAASLASPSPSRLGEGRRWRGARFYVGAATGTLLAVIVTHSFRNTLADLTKARATHAVETVSSASPIRAARLEENAADPRLPSAVRADPEPVATAESAPRTQATGGQLLDTPSAGGVTLTRADERAGTTGVAGMRPGSSLTDPVRQLVPPVSSATANLDDARDWIQRRASRPKRKLDPENPF